MKRVMRLRQRSGAVLAFVAVTLPVTLGVMALAIDLGMLYGARAEAQRTADAAALAGASAYIDYSIQTSPAQARANAWARAIQYAAENYAGNRMISTVETTGADGEFYHTEGVTVQTDLANNTVRVWIRSANHRTFFARFLGFTTGSVGAMAAAHVTDSGTSPCVIPIFLPDAPDINNPNIYDAVETGFGSANRNDYYAPDYPLPSRPGGGGGGGTVEPVRNYINDFGRRIPLWPGSGSSTTTEMGWVQGEPHPSNYGFFRRELDDPSGYDHIRQAILGNDCWDVAIGDTVYTTSGARASLTNDLEDLYDDDPNDTRWDHVSGTVVSDADNGTWRHSSRVFTVALIDPRMPPGGTHEPIVITNFTTVLLEPPPHPPANDVYPTVRIVPVTGSPDGCAGGNDACSLNVKILQLIE
jgi:Flp pilus assembly protein TadG